MNRQVSIILVLLMSLGLSGCSTMRALFGMEKEVEKTKPISDPFGHFYDPETDRRAGVILRSRRGDRTVELEIPDREHAATSLVVPLDPGESQNDDELDAYKKFRSSLSDREIASTLPQGNAADESRRHSIEAGLGLKSSQDGAPERDKSYLGNIDRAKQLFRRGRFEAALLEIDHLLQMYPTDPKLYEMRGTLLDRLGHEELALNAWKQAIKLDPKNRGLKKFLAKKEKNHQLRRASNE